MARRPAEDAPELPVFFQPRHTDETWPQPPTPAERRAAAQVRERGPECAARTATALRDFWPSRRGTAQALRALNRAWGTEFYRVPPEAELDAAAAREAFAGAEPVIDVQTHFAADRCLAHWNRNITAMYRMLMPDWWKGMDEIEGFSLAEYLRCVFLESETALAVLTSAPGLGPERMLFNRELAGTRELLERLGAQGRLLNHCVVHPNVEGELDAMERARDLQRPVGWKVYTLGTTGRRGYVPGSGWWLDDERVGIPFLERARSLGVKLICAHKGLSALVDTGSPRDVGPVAAAFPDLDFVIYHSGYEMALAPGDPEEGAYSDATAEIGVNRLLTSLRRAGVAPGRNVYAELGTTWFCLLKRPLEAAHVLGKLLLALGPERVVWGTDSIWYGPPQPAIDAFRAFQIPAALRERHGYPELTRELKAEILGRNAARVYGIDLAALRARAERDELAWVKAAVAEYRRSGVPSAG